jgi:tetratricopeptide (TPR) repeat protein
VVLEDQGRDEEAVGAYERVVELEGTFKEAHFNLACLYERLGDRGRALQHLKAYRKLEPELFPGRW